MIDVILSLSGNPVFNVIAVLLTIVSIAGLFITLFLLVTGLCRPMVRLGLSRCRQNICVVGNPDVTRMVRNDLVESCVVPKRRLKDLGKESLENIDDNAILVVCADGLENDVVLEAVKSKGKKAGVIVYTTKQLPVKFRNELNENEHVSMVNMRGRLVNEIMTLYMTTKTPLRKRFG